MKKKPSKNRIAIGVPTTGFTRIEWVESMLHGQKALLGDPSLKIEDVVMLYYCSSVIPKNRMEIVKTALKWEATHIIWIDDDMRFSPAILKALVKTFLELQRVDPEKYPRIIGANCIKRLYPIQYMATDFDDSEVRSDQRKGLEQVLYTGNAFTMMDMKLFSPDPEVGIPQPWFAFGWNENKQDFTTEDSYFMIKAMKHGYPTYVIHELGEHIDHVGSWVFKPQDRTGRRGHIDLPDWIRSGGMPGMGGEGEGGRVSVGDAPDSSA